MSPFQPTTVRGFSKYTRMTTSSVSASESAIGLRLAAYSSAALVSWMEQGPVTTRSRASLPSRIASIARRASHTFADVLSVRGTSSARMAGKSRGVDLDDT